MTESSQDAQKSVLLAREEAVAWITLNRPGSLNALNPDLTVSLRAKLGAVAADEAVRCVVIKGAGDAFMAGGDLRWFAELARMPEAERHETVAALFPEAHGLIAAIRALPKPVIAAVHGSCAGFGLSLMLACDLAIAARGTVFTPAYAQIGASPDGGSTYHLPRVAGTKRAFEIALLGERFSAEDAAAWGLLNRVVAAEELQVETANLAARLAKGPAKVLARTKALLNGAADNTLAEQLEAEAAAFTQSALEADFQEGIAAFLEKRKPSFQ